MKSGFSLVELLVTIGIIMVSMTAVFMIVNPIETLSQARDGRRISEVTSLDEAITFALQQNPAIFEGYDKMIYLSLPNISGGIDLSGYRYTCVDYQNLPPLVAPWKYNCTAQESLFKTDGTGWLPINFNSLAIRPLATLPIDPVNDAKKGLYYSYIKGWEISTKLESKKYSFQGADDRVVWTEGILRVRLKKEKNCWFLQLLRSNEFKWS